METYDGNINVKVAGKRRSVWVSDIINCKNYKCFHPHDCPVQGASGVRSSQERWMCLTNALRGCPDNPVFVNNSKKKGNNIDVCEKQLDEYQKLWDEIIKTSAS